MNPYLAEILEHLVPVLAMVFTVVLVALAKKGVQTFEKKTGLDIAEQHEALLDATLTRAVALAEEWAQKRLKTDAPKPDGAQKLHYALDFVEAEVQRLGLDVKGREHLTKMIEARLGLGR